MPEYWPACGRHSAGLATAPSSLAAPIAHADHHGTIVPDFALRVGFPRAMGLSPLPKRSAAASAFSRPAPAPTSASPPLRAEPNSVAAPALNSAEYRLARCAADCGVLARQRASP